MKRENESTDARGYDDGKGAGASHACAISLDDALYCW